MKLPCSSTPSTFWPIWIQNSNVKLFEIITLHKASYSSRMLRDSTSCSPTTLSIATSESMEAQSTSTTSNKELPTKIQSDILHSYISKTIPSLGTWLTLKAMLSLWREHSEQEAIVITFVMIICFKLWLQTAYSRRTMEWMWQLVEQCRLMEGKEVTFWWGCKVELHKLNSWRSRRSVEKTRNRMGRR